MSTDEKPAVEWATEALASAGRPLSGEPEVLHDRCWSLVVRLPSEAGPTWLKVNRGGTTYEVGVVDVLTRIAPAAVLAPIALDVERAWLLNPDGGPTLRQLRGEAPPDPEVLGEVLREYAATQRATGDHVDELVAVGTPDLRPERLPEVFDELLRVVDWAPLAQTDPGAPERVAAHRPLLVERSEELAARSAAAGLPMTLQHDDLHDNNVFAVTNSAGGTTYRVFDWGDACIAHPFATLLVGLNSFAHFRGVQLDDPAVRQVREAYLACWTDYASSAELGTIADLALAVAPLGRARCWHVDLVDASPDELQEYGEAVPGWLAELAPLPDSTINPDASQ